MSKDHLSGTGLFLRFSFALVLVYCTYNPEGYSYFHWIKASFGQSETGWLGADALKFLAGVALLAGWTVYLNATRNSLGLFGVSLIAALCGGVVWLLVEWDLLAADNMRAFVHLTEIVVAVILAAGMSWSHISRRLSGQIDVDDNDD